MLELRFLVIVLSGLCSGAILGASISTETEHKIRQNVTGWSIFSNGSLLGSVLNQIVVMLLLGVAFLAVGIAILQVGGAYPLCQPYDRYVLGGSWLCGAGIAKFGRYLYWKRRDPWV